MDNFSNSGNTASSVNHWILLASLSSSVLDLPHDLYPLMEKKDFNIVQVENIAEWRDDVLQKPIIQMSFTESQQMNILLEFSKNMASQSTNLDKEYTDFVNENFWDLI